MAASNEIIPLESKANDFILEEAYKQFFLDTERLELAYKSLEERFKSVQQSIQDAQTKLYGKIAELDFTNSYLDAILSHISQGLLFIDFNGIVTTYNAAAEEIFGVSAERVLLHSFWDHFSDQAFGISLKEILQARISRKNLLVNWVKNEQKLELEIDMTFVGRNTKTCPIDLQSSSSHSIQGLLLLVRNVTEFRKLQIVANRHDRLKDVGEMAARVAHEIRNPLGGIKGFATLLQQDLVNQPNLQQMASQIVSATDSLSLFVSKILNYTRPFQMHYEAVDLISFMQEMMQLVQADKALSPGTTCHLTTTLTSLSLSIDVQLFKSAILNLLVNALQAMPNGGSLDIEIDQKDDQVLIKIRDTGIGIGEENLDKIFSPFFTTKEEGNGLGLSEVHKVIQAHGGSIEVQSQVGKGSLFTVKVPLKIS